jgi:hypothetical protein
MPSAVPWPLGITSAGLAVGAASPAGSPVHAVQPAAVVLVLIWFGWLGVALLRAQRAVGHPTPVASPTERELIPASVCYHG